MAQLGVVIQRNGHYVAKIDTLVMFIKTLHAFYNVARSTGVRVCIRYRFGVKQ